MSPSDVNVIVERLDEHDKKLDEILTQAKATNGRVTALEMWKSRLMGIGAGVLLVGLVVDLASRLGLG